MKNNGFAEEWKARGSFLKSYAKEIQDAHTAFQHLNFTFRGEQKIDLDLLFDPGWFTLD